VKFLDSFVKGHADAQLKLLIFNIIVNVFTENFKMYAILGHFDRRYNLCIFWHCRRF